MLYNALVYQVQTAIAYHISLQPELVQVALAPGSVVVKATAWHQSVEAAKASANKVVSDGDALTKVVQENALKVPGILDACAKGSQGDLGLGKPSASFHEKLQVPNEGPLRRSFSLAGQQTQKLPSSQQQEAVAPPLPAGKGIVAEEPVVQDSVDETSELDKTAPPPPPHFKENPLLRSHLLKTWTRHLPPLLPLCQGKKICLHKMQILLRKQAPALRRFQKRG